MPDSPDAASEGQVDETSTPDADNQDPSTDDLPNSVDTDELRAAVDAAGQEAGLRADLIALKRATGHIPGLQKRLDGLQTAIEEIGSLKQSVARFDALLDALPEGLIPDRTLADLRPRTDSTADDLRKQIAALEDRLNGGNQQDEPDIDPARIAYLASVNAATEQVMVYAKSKDFTIADDDPAWGRALAAYPNDLSMAALDVIKHIDAEIARQKRVADKAGDAKGSTDNSRGARNVELTWDAMAALPLSELMKIPREQREAAMAKAGTPA